MQGYGHYFGDYHSTHYSNHYFGGYLCRGYGHYYRFGRRDLFLVYGNYCLFHHGLSYGHYYLYRVYYCGQLLGYGHGYDLGQQQHHGGHHRKHVALRRKLYHADGQRRICFFLEHGSHFGGFSDHGSFFQFFLFCLGGQRNVQRLYRRQSYGESHANSGGFFGCYMRRNFCYPHCFGREFLFLESGRRDFSFGYC